MPALTVGFIDCFCILIDLSSNRLFGKQDKAMGSMNDGYFAAFLVYSLIIL